MPGKLTKRPPVRQITMGFSIRNTQTINTAVRLIMTRESRPITQGRSKYELMPQARDKNHRPEPIIAPSE